jgi:hypothetical protein
MKQLILIGGLCSLTTISFSQQVSSERKQIAKPVENKETVLQTWVSDSVVIVNSMSRDAKAVVIPISKEVPENTEKQLEKTVVSSARKPD